MIENKKQEISNLTSILEGVYKKDQEKLAEEKNEISKKLNTFKNNAIKQLNKSRKKLRNLKKIAILFSVSFLTSFGIKDTLFDFLFDTTKIFI